MYSKLIINYRPKRPRNK